MDAHNGLKSFHKEHFFIIMLKLSQNKKGHKIFQLHRFLGPTYFDPTLVHRGVFCLFLNPPKGNWKYASSEMVLPNCPACNLTLEKSKD